MGPWDPFVAGASRFTGLHSSGFGGAGKSDVADNTANGFGKASMTVTRALPSLSAHRPTLRPGPASTKRPPNRLKTPGLQGEQA
jgi:hypothetical protein